MRLTYSRNKNSYLAKKVYLPHNRFQVPCSPLLPLQIRARKSNISFTEKPANA